ncbi:hypothetical protein BDA99DRAFT_418354, partial [Phascolomyces articulosus]
THIVSSIGPLTPPLTIDHSTSSPIPSCSTTALCYLPTRFQRMVEFYHTEIPIAYRDLGLGDLLVVQGFRWAETTKLLVIPTCPFVRRYLAKNNTNCDCVVENENEGL